MALATMWIAPLIIAALCLIIIRITSYAVKLSSVEVVMKAGTDTPKQPKELITEVFREPKFSRLMCAILASSIQNIQVMAVSGFAVIPIILGLNLPKYGRLVVMVMTCLYPFSGAVAGYAGVLLWKSIKVKDTISQGWIKVCLLIPFLSFGTLYSYSGIAEYGSFKFSWHDAIIKGLGLCISIPSTQLGGYLGARSKPIQLPILINKTTPIENYWTWIAFLALGFIASVMCCTEIIFMLVNNYRTSSTIYSVLLLAIATLLDGSACFSWLAIFNMQLFLGKLCCCWWKAFFTFGVPFGLYAFLRDVTSWKLTCYLTESLILASITTVTICSFGPVIIFIYYKLLSTVPGQV